MDLNNKYPQSERLKSRKLISEVFEEGSVVKSFPLRAHFTALPEKFIQKHQVGVSVSKRYFKKAVDRNKVKRLMREAYRTQKQLLDELPKPFAIMIIYHSNEVLNFQTIEQKMKTLLSKLSTK